MSTILIIEDDGAIHSLIKEALTIQGFQTVSAYSGTEGQLLFEQNQVDIILLDLMLPGMDGEELLREIRNHSAIPVIVISAKNDQASKLELLMNGADDYVTKPFDIKELIARINIQLRHAAKAVHSELEEISYKDIRVNLDTREVKVNDEIIHLTGREYAILLLFLENPQKVFSRANIYESVWNEPFFDSDQTINMHISNLRRKMNVQGANYIKTIWGIGFKFD
ncbi:response regulator transcription factor [Sporosarcina pasteurii]|uniref:Staphylococcal respiratory response protein A n=1 Tax=Sporosarcina pasteurii TaxID=1474 RepID=A0A380BCA3_SPOPA|nr:response regulator transcription factor [Sporosarcina pasteurii]MDS9472351.1 response regulator transcription factor [Sporosarcina pasteurii]QBQ06330.1 response regulator transcription factor [Sporosarcina pasteurii]SUI98949.1 Staphylococcal respiratory response protein A [Sporosarcina pasteurii]